MLIKATETDFDFFYSLYMHPQVNPYLLYELMDAASFKPIYENLLQQQVLYKFNDGVNDAGMCKLVLHKYRDGHKMYVGGLAINPVYGGKGYGVLLMQDIIAFAKTNNRSRIDLSVSTENKKAIALYKKCGFEIEGTLKNFSYLEKENRFVDEYMMRYLQNDTIKKIKLLFVCIENSNRSQMSQAFAKIIGGDRVEAYSAGSKPSGIVNPKAITAMREVDYDLSTHDSKSLEEVKQFAPFDAVVTMGCGDACPWMPAKQFIDWQIPDPKHMEPKEFNEVRDFIKGKVSELIQQLS